MNKIFTSIIFIILFQFQHTYSQIAIDSSTTPEKLIEQLIGKGLIISNVSYTGSSFSRGSFTNGASTNIGFDKGIILSTGDVKYAIGPNSSNNRSKVLNTDGDGDLDNELAKIYGVSVGDLQYTSKDASILEFDFKTFTDSISFEYVFASEEYHEYVGSEYNDIFAFFLSGPNPVGGQYKNYNMAKIPGEDLSVAINNINNGVEGNGPCKNCDYFINNKALTTTIEYDGFTTILKAGAKVVPCKMYHFKIAIADVSDQYYDSGVFLRANSFKANNSYQIELNYSLEYSAGQIAYEGCNYPIFTYALSEPMEEDYTINIISKSGTATENIDFQKLPDSIVIPAGDTSAQLIVEIYEDSIQEPEETIEIIYGAVLNFCQQDTFTIKLHDHISQKIIISNDTSICLNETAQIFTKVDEGEPPYTYKWKPAEGLDDTTSNNPKVTPNKTTTYNVEVYDNVGCFVDDKVTINIDPLPNITKFPADKDTIELLIGESYTFNATGGDSLWWNNNITNKQIISSKDLGLGYRHYTVSALNNATDCINREILTLNIIPWFIDLGEDILICDLGENVTLQPKEEYKEATYLWNTGDTTPSITITVDTLLEYHLTATIGSYSSIDTVKLNISDLALQKPLYKGCFTFIDIEAINGKPPYEYSIDGINYQLEKRFINIQPKEYLLYVKDSNGCIRDTLLFVNSISIPNYFSPNGDNINDTWSITGLEDCPSAVVFIFNKDSKILYQMKPTEAWDGNYKNHKLLNDTYWYAIDFKDGINRVLKNSLTIKHE